ncbi:MAG: aminodeoxychorismate/anthranilate synthase component II [Bacteroidetes bacterium HGW-Bacteroidetes-17]|jgi:anthranilate synthase component 2|nr:MAG: aminodeoxychorismate/anthranilate synthase component II [Bacteroidetes bacterium HGW-Bacteroidetes-17]
MNCLIIDNYDSFTYNLVHLVKEIGVIPDVIRNDKFCLEEVAKYDKIMLSPGPGVPHDAGLLKQVIKEFASSKSIFGVCLGQQAIAEVFGGTLINLEQVYHGVVTEIEVVVNDYIFGQIPQRFMAGRYHSWVVDPNLPSELETIAIDANGQIMALKHKTYDVRGVQFHPESIMTPNGKQIIQNFLNH